MLGDLVGVLLIVPITFAIKSLLNSNKTLVNASSLTKLNLGFILLSMIISLLLIQQGMAYYLKLFAFVPIVLFAYKNGWIGATISIFAFNILIVIASYVTSDIGNMLDKQLYLIAISTTGLFLGAAISEQKALNLQLISKNNDLSSANNLLTKLMKKNQFLASKVVRIQEDERKNLSRELHDEIGQNITALKVNINIIKKISKNEALIRPILGSINNIANQTYESIYNLMHSLRPRTLDDLGLKKALTSASFSKLLSSADIQFIPEITGNLSRLSDEINITIYRITQETITNAVKYSKATKLWLKLDINHPMITLKIIDDGIGFDAKNIGKHKSSFGLQGIEDRVTALGGEYYLVSNQGGTSHLVELML